MSLFTPPHPPGSRENSARTFNVLLNVLNLHAERSNSHAEHCLTINKTFFPGKATEKWGLDVERPGEHGFP